MNYRTAFVLLSLLLSVVQCPGQATYIQTGSDYAVSFNKSRKIWDFFVKNISPRVVKSPLCGVRSDCICFFENLTFHGRMVPSYSV